MLFVDRIHQGCCWREDLIDKDEDGFLRRQLDTLADDIHELADRQIAGDQVLFLVDGRDVGFLDFLADDLAGCHTCQSWAGKIQDSRQNIIAFL